MKNVEQIVNMDKFTQQGKERIIEAYEIIKRMDKGLSKEDITIITNFFDEYCFEFYVLMREKEREMHGIEI